MSDKYGVTEFNTAHEQMMDYILLNPAATNEEVAQAFNYSASWVGILRASDAFRARLAEKQAAISDDVRDEVKIRLETLARQSLDRLLKKVAVEDNHHEIRETVKLSLTGLGVITPKGQVNISDNRTAIFQTVSSDALSRAREKMLERQKLTISAPTVFDNAQESSEG